MFRSNRSRLKNVLLIIPKSPVLTGWGFFVPWNRRFCVKLIENQAFFGLKGLFVRIVASCVYSISVILYTVRNFPDSESPPRIVQF